MLYSNDITGATVNETAKTETSPVPQDEQSAILKYLASIEETRRKEIKLRKVRIWATVLSFTVGPIIFFSYAKWVEATRASNDHVAVVRIEGELFANKTASVRNLIPSLQKAFDDEHAKGVLLLINSPGGSPVQASIIYNAIKEQKAQHPNTKIIAVGEDSMTSAAYWIACAADEIWSNGSTLVGSIGVKIETFGVVLDNPMYQRMGIERRVWTAGEKKSPIDMFKKITPGDQKKVNEWLTSIHSHFIRDVKIGRGARLKGDDTQIFSGEAWAGDMAKDKGLVDNLGDYFKVLKVGFGTDEIIDYTPAPGLFDNLKGIVSEAISDAITASANRYFEATVKAQ